MDMKPNVNLDAAYIPSEDVVARVIEGEFIIVPLAAGIGETELHKRRMVVEAVRR